MRPLVCLCLTGKTLQEDLELVNKYRSYIDIAELRVDQLTNDERLHVRKFPSLAGLPCILTIRRTIDGGAYYEGEATRTTLFARALAFADQDIRKNFAYIDLETDFLVPSLQEAALAFGTKIKVEDVFREGITKIEAIDIEYAKEFKKVIKLLAIVKDNEGRLELRVHPTMIPENHPLANVNDSFNAVLIRGNAVGDVMFYGRGAGDLPTGSAVVSDIVSILRSNIDIGNFNPVVKNNLWKKEIKRH